MTDAKPAPDLDEEDEEEEPPGLWTSFGIALRLIVGWFCVAIGSLNLIVEVDRVTGSPDVPYFLFHSVLFVGGLVLLGVSWMGRSPGPVGYTAFGLVLAGGTVLSAISVTNTVCCMQTYAIRHGYPFSFLARDEGVGARWHVDSQHLLANLLFWGYVGLFVLVAVSLARRAPGRPPQAPKSAPHAYAHAQPPAAAHVREPPPAGD